MAPTTRRRVRATLRVARTVSTSLLLRLEICTSAKRSSASSSRTRSSTPNSGVIGSSASLGERTAIRASCRSTSRATFTSMLIVSVISLKSDSRGAGACGCRSIFRANCRRDVARVNGRTDFPLGALAQGLFHGEPHVKTARCRRMETLGAGTRCSTDRQTTTPQ